MARLATPSSLAALALGCGGLAACVVLPATVDTYDAGCQVVSHHIVLQSVQIAEINHCANQGCAALVIAAAATAAATTIVSGSIMIVGNAAYWIERQASCQGPAPVPAPPGVPATVAPG